MSEEPDVRIGLVGYGWGGRYFHAPVIEAAAGAVLAGVVTTSAARRADLAIEHPGVRAHDSLDSLVASGIDVLVLSVPAPGRENLVREALGSCAVVILDKPFAMDAGQARELAAYAEASGARLGVYQNRRWDTNIATLGAVLAEGRLGPVHSLESMFDQNEPRSVESASSGGALLDLGSHLVDQALWLFGPVDNVAAGMTWTPTSWGVNDSAFTIRLDHASGVTSWLSANKLAEQGQRLLRVQGEDGLLTLRGNDIQAEALLEGQRPADNPGTWGFDPVDAILAAGGRTTGVTSAQGRYHAYYELLVDSVRHQTPLPVCACEAIACLRVLDAARLSATLGGTEVAVPQAENQPCPTC